MDDIKIDTTVVKRVDDIKFPENITHFFVLYSCNMCSNPDVMVQSRILTEIEKPYKVKYIHVIFLEFHKETTNYEDVWNILEKMPNLEYLDIDIPLKECELNNILKNKPELETLSLGYSTQIPFIKPVHVNIVCNYYYPEVGSYLYNNYSEYISPYIEEILLGARSARVYDYLCLTYGENVVYTYEFDKQVFCIEFLKRYDVKDYDLSKYTSGFDHLFNENYIEHDDKYVYIHQEEVAYDENNLDLLGIKIDNFLFSGQNTKPAKN